MNELIQIESAIKRLYGSFFEELNIDPNSGIISGKPLRFSGMPYLGFLYPYAKERILFIGMDIGQDELFHSFESRRINISHTACGLTEIPRNKPFNPHIAGTYAMAFALLHSINNWNNSWQSFSSIKDKTAYRAIQDNHTILPVNLLDFVALTNVHKFVTIDRVNRSGGQDRKWNQYEKEIQLLRDEISLLSPDIIVIQGISLAYLKTDLNIPSSTRVIISAHPAARSRYYRSIGYIESLLSANEIISQ
jgi:hypothetical protein